MTIKPQLFCFTYAGGNSGFFDEIEKDLGSIDLIKLEYAGHGIRHKENYYDSFDSLADDIFLHFKEKYVDNEYGLFGYSMGSITVYELIKRIVGNGIKKPSCVFLAAHEPVQKPKVIDGTLEEVNDWIKKYTISFGGIPSELINDNIFWRVYLPVYKADYTIIGEYSFERMSFKTNVPLVVFYSETDTRLEDMKLWEKCFIGDCEYHCYKGNHFFIKEHHEEMAEIIKRKMGVS